MSVLAATRTNKNDKTTSRGIVYCLTNPAMPELVKIGLVESDKISALKRRMSDLYSTSAPVPFELECAVVVDDAKTVEELLHEAFDDFRENSRREFFGVDPEKVVAAMKLTRGKLIFLEETLDDNISQADIDARKRLRQRENKKLSGFQFGKANISVGEYLVFTSDENLTAQVLDEKNKILFEGEETTPSGAANKIRARQGLYNNVAGTLYWKYNGKTLNQIRRDLEEAEQDSNEA